MDHPPLSASHAPADDAVRAVEAHMQTAVLRFGLLLGSLVRRDATATVSVVERIASADLPQDGHTWFLVEHSGPEPGVMVLADRTVVRLAEVLMGGPGLDCDRPPTKLEASVVANRLTTALATVAAGLEEFGLGSLCVVAAEGDDRRCAPDLVRATIELTVGEVSGTVELALPAGMLGAGGPTRAVANPHPTVVEALERVPVTVAIRFEPVELAAQEVDELAVGDVIRLDHPVGRSLVGDLDGRPVMRVRPGRRGRRLAVEVEEVFA